MISLFLPYRKIDKDVPSLVFANHDIFILAFISFPFLFTSFPKKLNLDPSWLDVLYYLGVAMTSLSQILLVRGFQIGSPVQAGVLLLSRVLLSVILGVTVLSESFTWSIALGTVLLMGSITLVTIATNRPKENQQLCSIQRESTPC